MIQTDLFQQVQIPTQLQERPQTVKEKVLEILQMHEWITIAELRAYFDPYEPGSQSVDRYLREGKGFLKADGYVIVKRHRNGATWEYKLIREAK